MKEPFKRAKGLLFLLSVLCLCSRIKVFARQNGEAAFPFYEDGDVVGVIGDSITHVQYGPISYIEALYDYYLSRFPERKIEFRNLGTAGYTAEDVLNIYDQDPAFQGINKAIVMLGMNEALNKVPAEEYLRGMEALIDKLKAEGLKGEDILVLAPTTYDDTCALNYDRRGNPYQLIDHLLAAYTNQLAEKTEEWGTRYIDLHTPMVELTKEIQKENPNNTLTRGDCIHPSAAGQMLISYYILQAQGGLDLEAGILVPEEGEAWTARGEIADLYRGEKGISWVMKADTLPTALTEELREYPELYPQAEALYQEPLMVEGLVSDTFYKVYIGENELGTYTGNELAEGVNLAFSETHPLQEISQELKDINRRLHQKLAEHRAMWIEFGQAGYTKEEIQAAYESWRTNDTKLREEMYALAQAAAGRILPMSVVREGCTVQELEQERAEAKKAAAEKSAKEVRKKIQKASLAGEKEQELNRIKWFAASAGFTLIAAISLSIYLGKKKRSKKVRKRKRKKKKRLY